MISPERIDQINAAAQDAFWAKVAEMLPEAKSGDFPPLETVMFDQATRRAIRSWARWNATPEVELPYDVTELLRDPEAHGFVATDPDTDQYVRRIDETRFWVIEEGEIYDIEVTDFEHNYETIGSAYYDSLDAMREETGEDFYALMAECIAEMGYADPAGVA